jgi:hypothetical protein
MKENEKKAFDFAADVTKQLITLSTAIITLTITFSRDLINFSTSSSKCFLLWAWILFIAAVFFGIWTLMALTGTLQPMKKDKSKDEESDQKSKNDLTKQPVEVIETDYCINRGNIRLPSILQILCFIVALIFTIVFGYSSLKKDKPMSDKTSRQTELSIIRRTEYSIKPDLIIDTLTVK